MRSEAPPEPIIEPDLPIVDPHHHLWFLTPEALTAIEALGAEACRAFPPAHGGAVRYLFDELMADLTSGHNIRGTVFVDGHAMFRKSGPVALRSVGEVEFANGVAAMAGSGTFGAVQACAGIVGNVDLRIGDAVEDVLNMHIRAGGGRYRGVRCGALTAYDADPKILGSGGVPHLLQDPEFRSGFERLNGLGLSFDAWLLEPQLPELIDLARAFPRTQIILDHLGGPVGVGRYLGKRDERYPVWRKSIRALSACPNVAVKIGGLGMPMPGFKSFRSSPLASSADLALEWRPYVEAAIEAFGAERCMFESNFPVDAVTCSYPVLWNAFKRLAAGASRQEKAALFEGTAKRVYRLEL